MKSCQVNTSFDIAFIVTLLTLLIALLLPENQKHDKNIMTKHEQTTRNILYMSFPEKKNSYDPSVKCSDVMNL